MKKFYCVMVMLAIALSVCFGQDAETAEQEISKKFVMNLEPSVGYMFKSDYQDLKINLSLNNVTAWKRLGFYTSFEIGLGNDHFRNLWGGTFSACRWCYVFAGIDLFTSHGIANNSFKDSRKELGLGFTPWKESALRLGYSTAAGFTAAIGWQIPIGKK